MATRVRIGNRWIGDGEPCFIIAEAGSNHNGNLEQAKRLIDVAASAGADAVKFQVFRADKLYPKSAGLSDYLKMPKPIYEIIAGMEMPYEWLPELAAYCRKTGLLFLASAFDEESADQLEPHLEAFKIASYEMTHFPLVRHVANKGKPVIISTGTANLDEVAETVDEFRRSGNENLILMQCTAAYPSPLESLNLRTVAMMKLTFNVPVGLSDHSRDSLVGPLAAVAVGANLVEKHFTLSNELPGPDHRFALEPVELRIMIQKVRETERALGSGQKVMHPVEAELRGFARRSIFAVRDIAAGENYSKENVAVLRCGKLPPGLHPKDYPELLGQRAAKHIRAESAIQADDVRRGEERMLKIRSVTDEDCSILWEWLNDPEVRASAFESDPIPWEKHVAWFRRKRVDPDCYMYMLMDQDDCPIGQVRCDIQTDGSAQVDISIARDHRGRGYGVKAIRYASDHLLQAAKVTQIVAYAKAENVASIRAFGKAGFVNEGKEWMKGHEAVRMTLRKEQL